MINNDWPADSWNKPIDISEVRKIIKEEIRKIIKEEIKAGSVNKQPVVDAIPIEWIRKYTNHRTVEFGDQWLFINCMINDWENENERMDNK